MINIDQHTIEIRKLVNPNKRITIPNVCPSIPHTLITNELSQLGVRLMSNITFVRAGLQDSRFSHIISNRREMFIEPESFKNLPSSIIIKHDNTPYRFFLCRGWCNLL